MTNPRRRLRDPSSLKSLDRDDNTVRVIIETPKGSRNKYAFDAEEKVFTLKKVLARTRLWSTLHGGTSVKISSSLRHCTRWANDEQREHVTADALTAINAPMRVPLT